MINPNSNELNKRDILVNSDYIRIGKFILSISFEFLVGIN